MTYLEIDELINNTFSSLNGVKQVIRNSNKINDKHTKYVAVAYDFISATLGEDTTTYSFNIYAMELMGDSDNNSVPNHSKLMQILENGIVKLSEEVDIEYPLSMTANSVKFADVLDVVMVTVGITVENTVECYDD